MHYKHVSKYIHYLNGDNTHSIVTNIYHSNTCHTCIQLKYTNQPVAIYCVHKSKSESKFIINTKIFCSTTILTYSRKRITNLSTSSWKFTEIIFIFANKNSYWRILIVIIPISKIKRNILMIVKNSPRS